MRRLALPLALLLAAAAAAPAGAQTLVAARTVRALAILGPEDLSTIPGTVPGALSDPIEAVGLEARVILHAGRPIRPGDVGPPALVERNGLVTLVYRSVGLAITAEGRALGRGAAGEAIRVLNLASRATVTGIVGPDGRVHVAAGPAPLPELR
jgi:flagella basal body P-ring formation protein FlgA